MLEQFGVLGSFQMQSVTLAVTERVIHQVTATNASQRQISIRDASPELLAIIQTARKEKPITLNVNGAFELSVRDTSAIWSTHQKAGLQADDFNDLYNLLARRSGHAVTFYWGDA